MISIRWLFTFIGFPIGGFIAVHTVGGVEGAGSGAAAGLIAGAVVGTAQWLVLRDHGIGPAWVARTALGLSGGLALAGALTSGGTSVADLVLTGAVAGAVVGAVQAAELGSTLPARATWVTVVSGSWALGWLTSANVIVDADRGYAMFGASGAAIVTVITGVVLARLLGRGPVATPRAGTVS
jgi:hypothetical protein